MRFADAAILAGGASRRMGRDKSFVLVNGKPMIQHVIEQVSVLALPTMIITNTPEPYAVFGLPCYTDTVPGSGSLGGLYTALAHSSAAYTLCVACDMPFLNPSLLRHLLYLSDGCDAVVPVTDGRSHGLHAVYSQRCLPAVQAQIQTGNLRISELYQTLQVRYVTQDELTTFDPGLRSLRNLNTVADMEQAHNADRPAAGVSDR